MKCPKCHNENKYDSLTCDYCMAPLPMTKEREAEIKRIRRLERKAKFEKSMNVFIGMGVAVLIIVIITVIFFIKRG